MGVGSGKGDVAGGGVRRGSEEETKTRERG